MRVAVGRPNDIATCRLIFQKPRERGAQKWVIEINERGREGNWFTLKKGLLHGLIGTRVAFPF